MAYRDQHVDVRIAELEALIAAGPAQRATFAALQQQYEELEGRVAVLGARRGAAEADLARRREGGVRATVTGWVGRSLPELEAETAKLVEEHARLGEQFGEVAEARRALGIEVAKAEAAHDELAAILDRALDALRVAEGPSADEARALDTDDLRDRAQREAIVKVRDTVDLARTAVWQLQSVASDLKSAHGLGGTVSIVLELFDSPLERPETALQRDQLRVRLSETFEYALVQLIDVVATYDRSGCKWFAALPRERVYELGSRRRARVEETELVRDAKAAIDCMFELARGLTQVHDQLLRNERERLARRRELITGMR